MPTPKGMGCSPRSLAPQLTRRGPWEIHGLRKDPEPGWRTGLTLQIHHRFVLDEEAHPSTDRGPPRRFCPGMGLTKLIPTTQKLVVKALAL